MPRSFCVCCCMCACVCVCGLICVRECLCWVNLNLIEKHVTQRQQTASTRRTPPSSALQLVFFSPGVASFWRSLALTTSTTTSVSRSASCILPLGSCASLSPSLWFPGNVVCSLDNVERCASFGAQAWLLTLPHVAVRCGVVRRQRCVFACQMVLYRFLVTLPAPLPLPYLCIPFSIPAN